MTHMAPAIPAALMPFNGRIMDTDSHEYTPSNFWVEQFGSVAQDLVDAFKLSTMPLAEALPGDLTPITAETVWKTKLSRAPGAFDLKRRLEVMDFTGVDRQIVFPGSVGIYGV